MNQEIIDAIAAHYGLEKAHSVHYARSLALRPQWFMHPSQKAMVVFRRDKIEVRLVKPRPLFVDANNRLSHYTRNTVGLESFLYEAPGLITNLDDWFAIIEAEYLYG